MTDSIVRVTASPHLRSTESTTKIMWSVVISLVPVVASSIFFFGPGAIFILLACCAGCLLAERCFGSRPGSLADGSAMITGLLLGLTLPPGFPLWMAFLGGAFGMVFGKIIFGGLGQNIFNPALVGRAFLQAAFPVAITTWPAKAEHWSMFQGDIFAIPLFSPAMDAVTEATPLGNLKFGDDPTVTSIFDLFFGTTGGSLGETSALLLLLGGLYLALRGHLNWHIPVSIFVSVFLFSGLFYTLGISPFPPLFMLFSGGLMLGAIYMATDMVTSPVTNRGCWIFGFGIGLLVTLIRIWGGLPEGVMYAILLMNAMVPFIDRATQPQLFGSAPKDGGKEGGKEGVRAMTDVVRSEEFPVPVSQPAPEQKKVSTFNLIATLTIIGALAGLLIVLVDQHTRPIIDKYRAEQLQKAVYEVLPGATSYATYYLVGNSLSLTLPQAAKVSEYKRVYIGYDAALQIKGVAIERGEPGFQDIVRLIFGYDPHTATLLGMKVLESKETPGLGDKIFKDQAFVDQFFAGPQPPLVAVKAGAGKGRPNEIDTITGATISSKVVIDIINHALQEWTPVLDQGIPLTPPAAVNDEAKQ